MPKITAITRQKKNRQRLSIFIDGKFAFGCSEELLNGLGITKGDELSEDQMLRLQESILVGHIHQKAISYLSRRSRSISEMRKYLVQKGFDECNIAETIEWLCELNYLDDAQFARDWVESRLRVSPRGRRKLLTELYQKGIDRELAEKTVDSNLPVDQENEVAYDLLQNHRKRFSGKERLEIKRKIYNFLSYRGFSTSVIIDACNRFLEELFENSGD